MRTVVLLVCFGLLLCVERAGAEEAPPVVYKFKISAHPDIVPNLDKGEIQTILARASRLLTVRNSCKVTLKLLDNDPITPFPHGTPKEILKEEDLEAVHQVTACGSTPYCYDVKVVSKIEFCKTDRRGGVVGCAWRSPEKGPKTMIVTHTPRTAGINHIVWAHEFGHTTGLQHRRSLLALMTYCDMDGGTLEVKDVECNCFRAGPGNQLEECRQPDPDLVCPPNRRRRLRID